MRQCQTTVDEFCTLIQPRRILEVDRGLKDKIAIFLCAHYNPPPAIIRRSIPLTVESWARLRFGGDGTDDTLRAAAMVHTNADDMRDASFVRVCT